MNLLVVRHGRSRSRSRHEGADEQRPLTDKGKELMRKNARGLGNLVDVPVLVTSPYRRARQTARILRDEISPEPGWMETDVLVPRADPGTFIDWYNEQREELPSPVTIVGHNPHQERFISFLLSGERERNVRMKKGGAALIHTSREPSPGEGRLEWLLEPEHLRGLA